MRDKVSWGNFAARIAVGAFCIGWGALARYASTRHPDFSERFWLERLRGRARKVRNSRRQKGPHPVGREGARFYRCSGNAPKDPSQKSCGCSRIDASALERHVWRHVTEIASDSKKLQALAAEWIGMAEVDTTALVDRIAALDHQIEGMNASITAVIIASAKQSKSADAIETATAVLNDELQQLQNLRDEAAEWLAEMEESERQARDLIALASMAKESFPGMAPEQQAAILSMMELNDHGPGARRSARRRPLHRSCLVRRCWPRHPCCRALR
ncbi:hypothetical protein ACIQWL_53400 [Streptomyces mirabilis]|uniref:hypothetical protein n=1 Tax=Streptomyces mirabilis TaxID=68239 RepID=UPI0033E3763E